jgi:hypothetical protein
MLVEQVKTDHRRAGLRVDFGGGMQSRVVGKAEIVAKPDDAGRRGLAGHQVVNSAGAGWVHAPGETLQLRQTSDVLHEGTNRNGWRSM